MLPVRSRTGKRRSHRTQEERRSFSEVAENWTELCSSILGTSEPVNEELRRGAEGISKHSVSVTRFSYCLGEGREKLRKEFANKKGTRA